MMIKCFVAVLVSAAVASGAHPPRTVMPWEGENGAKWRAQFAKDHSYEFTDHPTTSSPEVYPHPANQTTTTTTFSVSKSLSFDLQGPAAADHDAHQFLLNITSRYARLIFAWDSSGDHSGGDGERLVEGGVSSRRVALESGGGEVRTVVVRVLSANLTLGPDTDQSYNVTVGAGSDGGDPTIEINATTVYGAVYGLETTSQLVCYNLTGKNYYVQQNDIIDFPRYPFRGLMVDASRNFMTLNALLELVDAMGYFKMNVLHLHLTDDQSWPLHIEKYLKLADWGAFSNFSHTYTMDDMRYLVEYARERSIRVVPEIDLPGHSGMICKSYPEFCSRWFDPPNSTHALYNLVDPTKESMWTFLKDVYTELAEVFTDVEYHIGGDEVWTVPWQDNPDIQKWLKQHTTSCPDDASLTCGTTTGLHRYFTRRLINTLRDLGKRVIGWAPGIDTFNAGDHGDADYSNWTDVTLDNWNGFSPQGTEYWQNGQAEFTNQSASVILSGPLYVIDRWPHINNGSRFSFHDILHTDPRNFTAGNPSQYDRVRGAKLCVWDDAARTDSGNLAPKVGLFIAAASESLWVREGYINPKDFPQDYYTSMHIKDHRCRLQRRGYTFEPVEYIAIPCPLEWSPALPNHNLEDSRLAAENARLRAENESLRRMLAESHRLTGPHS